jgi:hypothetical protein
MQIHLFKSQLEKCLKSLLTCLELGPNTRSNAKVLVILSTGLSFTTTSRLFGQSTILRDFMPFSSEFSGLKIKKTVSIV